METIANTELIVLLKEAAANPISFEVLMDKVNSLDDLWRCDYFIL